MSLEVLLLKQQALGNYIQRFLTNLRKVGQEKLTLALYETRLDLLESYWNKFQEQNEAIIVCPEYIDSNYAKDDIFSSVEDAYLDTKAYIRQQLRNSSGNTIHTPEPGKENISTARLPKLTLPIFSGDYLAWENFRDLFITAVHEVPTLSGAAKLQHLKSLVTGEAAKIIHNVPVTDANYDEAWGALVARYDDKRILTAHHLNHILSLKASTSESAANLKRLFDTTSESRQALRNLGRPVDHWDDWFVHLTVQKLDPITRKDWETTRGSSREIPTYDDLSNFLIGRIRALDVVASSPMSATTPSRRSPGISTVRAHSSRVKTTSSSMSPKNCPHCEGKHYIGYCPEFKSKSPKQRQDLIARLNLCYNCLRDHQASSCPSSKRCLTCAGEHHTLLHVDSNPVLANTTREISSAHARTTLREIQQPTLLATVVVKVSAPSGKSVIARALLDQGSEATYISEDLTQRLQLARKRVHVPVTGMGATHCGTVKSVVLVQLSSVLENYSSTIQATAFVLPHLIKTFRPLQIQPSSWPHLKHLKLADADHCSSGAIDLVIGADLYGYILLDGLARGPPGTPIAQHTVFGWVLSGKVDSFVVDNQPNVTNFHCSVDLSLTEELRKFWEVEEVSQSQPLTPEEQYCEEHFLKTHYRTPEGRFVVRLPKRSDVVLGHSRATSLRSFHSNETRRQRDEVLNHAYQEFMREYQQLEHMAPIGSTSDISEEVCYLPHHAVWKTDGVCRKIRVVFNASARTSSGNSLNDCLFPGPKLQQDLSQVLLRWRQHRFVFMADIVKMFRQIWVHPEDQRLQRIFWRDSPSQDMQEFQLKTVTYGTACAPFLAIRCLQQLATDEYDRFPEAAKVISHQMYVDDVLSGSDTLSDAIALKKQLQGLLMVGGFKLAKWSSNVSDLADTTDAAKSLSDGSVKTLGLLWQPDSDTFGFRVQLEMTDQVTKRSILSCIAKLFDPLGWLAPVLVVAKMFLQDLWTSNSDWDSALHPSFQESWTSYYRSLEQLQEVRIPRWTFRDSSSSWELHGFCDASQRAYAAAIYIRVQNASENCYRTILLTAKTKVAPIKVLSLPRLELCGAVLLARLLKNVQNTFQGASNVYAWTDSQVTLCWLRDHPSRWKCFIANRTSEIHRLIPEAIWNHVPSGDNAADPASRGIPVSALLESRLWWHGPSWLSQSKSSWPASFQPESSPAVQEEKDTRRLILSTGLSTVQSWSLQDKYSSLHRLLRVTAWISRFARNSRLPSNERVTGTITTTELQESRRIWTGICQRDYFSSDIRSLTSEGKVQKGSSLFRLRPFLDADKLLRVGGRLNNAPVDYDEKHPLILPAQSGFTKLLVRDAHTRTLHGGPQLTLSVLGTRYWIVRGRNLVRKLLHECQTCYRHKATAGSQLMGQLPTPRVTPNRPFSHAGVDYAGPILLRASKGRDNKCFKGYVALFVCLSTKAIHLEAVSDLTTEAFLAAFRRFTSRRGIPSDLYSDQSTTFRGADAELRALFKNASQENQQLSAVLANDGTQWHFIPPRSPHFGGLWEAGVKSFKHHLRRVIGETRLTFEELTTVLAEIEACLNSRPLTPISSSPDDISALTPGHFLIGTALKTVPEPSLLDDNPNRLGRWKLLQSMQQHFWKRWSTEYLHQLRQLTKWPEKQENLKIGDLVLLLDEGLPPSKWRLGRISSTHPGPDGLVRVVNVRTSTGDFKRSIAKVAKLPVQSE